MGASDGFAAFNAAGVGGCDDITVISWADEQGGSAQAWVCGGDGEDTHCEFDAEDGGAAAGVVGCGVDPRELWTSGAGNCWR